MKTLLLSLLLFTVLTSVVTLQAQFYIGIQSGVGFAMQKIEVQGAPLPLELSELVRPLGGVLVGYQFSNSLAVQSEFNYLTKGYSYPYQQSKFNPRVSFGESYLYGYFEIPLLFRYTLPRIVSALDIHTLAGLSVSILESSLISWYEDSTATINGVSTTRRSEFSHSHLKSSYNNLEISIGGGIGLSYELSSVSRVFLTGRYMIGLTDIVPNLPGYQVDVYNRTLHLNIGYMLIL